jgi:hypothetical protein
VSNTVYNARVQLLATALNNLGVAVIVAGIIAPMVNGTLSDFLHIAPWVIFGVDLAALAQIILGTLRT